MAGKRTLAVGFKKLDKRQVTGRVGHTRTGACTAKGKCYHTKIKGRR